jgi:hypothetical protein
MERLVRRCGKGWLYRHGEPFVAFNGAAAPTLAEAIDQIEALRAGWQPIETAPKDGTFVLVYWRDPPQDYPPDVLLYSSESGWVDDYGSKYMEPTHWQPLPEEPTDG